MFLKLNNGNEIPQIAVGTWKLNNKNNIFELCDEALSLGISHIDTATFYENENFIGDWISKQKREDVFITTKLHNNDHDNAVKALDTSLSKLKTNYVDLYLIHWPVNSNGEFNLEKVWRQMESLVISKKARSIGVSNFGIKNLTKLLKICKIKPVVNQIEVHPYLPQYEIRDFCKKNNIIVEAYSPFGSGNDGEYSLVKDKTINEIATKYSATPQQVILSFLLKEGLVVIPRTSSKEHFKSNSKLVDLKYEDHDKIKNISISHRFIDPVSFGEKRFD